MITEIIKNKIMALETDYLHRVPRVSRKGRFRDLKYQKYNRITRRYYIIAWR